MLKEGGYEGDDAMISYGRPGPLGDDIEEVIARKSPRAGRPRRRKNRGPHRAAATALTRQAAAPSSGERIHDRDPGDHLAGAQIL